MSLDVLGTAIRTGIDGGWDFHAWHNAEGELINWTVTDPGTAHTDFRDAERLATDMCDGATYVGKLGTEQLVALKHGMENK